jgi:hypothetical protein
MLPIEQASITHMKRILERFATGRIVLGLFALSTLVYLWIILISIPAVIAEAPGTKLFDMSPSGYSHEDAQHILESIGESGRNTYLFHQLPVDTVYPGLFAVTYALMLFWVFGKFAPKGSVWFRLSYLPIAAGIFDYCENAGIFTMLISYPDVFPGVVLVASICTMLKSLLTVFCYLTLLMGLIAWRVKAISLNKNKA